MATACGSRVKDSPASNGGPSGDLYVFLKVQEHAFFERHENDLHCTIPVNIAQAALGAEITVPTLGEAATLKIPEGTQTGAQFRLRNQGHRAGERTHARRHRSACGCAHAQQAHA